MRARRVLLALLISGLAGCVHRYPADAGRDRDGVSGVPLRFGQVAEPVPEGTQIRWEFGDGSSAPGPQVEHAFAQAGEYRVRVEVSDGRGARSSECLVRIARRPPAAAVPPGAATAVLVDRAFARVSSLLAVAERFLGPQQTASFLRGFERLLGFDPSRPELVAVAGIDPEEGIASFRLDSDGGDWLAVGVSDEKAALETLRAAIARNSPSASFEAVPGGLVARDNGEAIWILARYGYLYLRSAPKDGSAPSAAALAEILEGPAEGLFADAAFARLRARVKGEELFVFARDLAKIGRAAGLAVVDEVQRPTPTPAALALTFSDSQIEAEAFVVTAFSDAARARAFRGPRSEVLLKSARAGAFGYLTGSFDSEQLKAIARGPRGCPLEALLAGSGLSCEALVEMMTGEISGAFWFDAAHLWTDFVRGQLGASSRYLGALVAVEVRDRPAAADQLRRSAKATASATLIDSGPALAFERSGGLGDVGLGMSGDTLLAGMGEVFGSAFKPEPQEATLADWLASELPADSAGHALAFVDVAGLVDRLRFPPTTGGLDPARVEFAQTMIAAYFERPHAPMRTLLPLRDALIELWPDPQGQGLMGRARLRLR